MRVAQRTLRRSPPAVAAADVTQSLHKRLRTGPLVAGDGEYCRPPCRGRVRDPTAASIASQPSATVHRSSMQSARVLTRVAWAQYGTACAAAYQPGGSRFSNLANRTAAVFMLPPVDCGARRQCTAVDSTCSSVRPPPLVAIRASRASHRRMTDPDPPGSWNAECRSVWPGRAERTAIRHPASLARRR